MKVRQVLIGAVCVVLASLASPANADWSRQLGTSGDDRGCAVAVDTAGNVFMAGTIASFDWPNDGVIFLAKYDSSGNRLWMNRFAMFGSPYDVKTDSYGNVFVDYYDFEGGDTVVKYDASGNFLWETGDHNRCSPSALALDAEGNLFRCGTIWGEDFDSDAYVSKYDTSGKLLWTRHLGSFSPEPYYMAGKDCADGFAADADGNVFLRGNTGFSLDGTGGPAGGFLAKYDSSGNLLWTRQPWGLGGNMEMDAAGNLIFLGSTLAKYDTSGNLLWTREWWMTFPHGYADNIRTAMDQAGNIFISGNSGYAFIDKYDPSGNFLWTCDVGTFGVDVGVSGVAVNSDGNVFATGSTSGSFFGPNAGGTDAFLVKYDVPEPATLGLLLVSGLALLKRSR